MVVQSNGMNCRSLEKGEVAVNQGEKECENMSFSLVKLKFTAPGSILSVRMNSKLK